MYICFCYGVYMRNVISTVTPQCSISFRQYIHNVYDESSNGNIFRVTGPLCGEYTAQRPVTRSFDVLFDLRLNKRLSKQS